MNNQGIIVIVGPTASGKSDLAVKLAKKFHGEIISADSRQVYRGMDLGTGKITKKERRGVPHYLLDVASPRQRFTAAQFKKLGLAAIKKIRVRNQLPIICGGTGFYIQALVDNLAIPEVKPDWKLRLKLEKKSTEELFIILKKIDPRRAKNIDSKNRRRLIRAIEIVKTTGEPVPDIRKTIYKILPALRPASAGLRRGEPNPPLAKEGKDITSPLYKRGVRGDFLPLFIGIRKSLPELQNLIHQRLLKRLNQGMIEEVKKLRQGGVSWKRLEDFGLEYRWVARFLQNKILRDEMMARLQKDIEHFAKRQMTWFKRDPRIHWIKNYQEAEKLAKEYLKK